MKKKSVVVVGNAPTLLFKELGKIIDSHDIVIRMNGYVIEGYEKHVGTKTNIYSRSHSPAYPPYNAEDYDEFWVKPQWKKWKNRYGFMPLKNMKENMSKYHELSFSKFKSYNKNKKIVNEGTGLSTIRYAINRFNKEKDNPISIVGFNCFTGVESNNSQRIHYYLKEPSNVYKLFKKNNFKNLNHSFSEEKETIIKLIDKKLVKPLYPEEIYQSLDTSKLEKSITYVPEHYHKLGGYLF
jgi:hypothetical protein